ncbi:MAG: 4-(cytidine 5'-diphospho)-2-C-methyl-D-erythritol kinase [Clostridia bacterium]|nr:4-(cytidine 5'-diphospho)-2-C-methyl-D-erythritol kinase [Clostridia bacterium]
MIEERAYAKLNLTLGVLYKRVDGYHAIDSIMQTVDLFDSLTIEKSKKIEISVTGMTLPQENTMYKAATAYKKYSGCGCTVRCIKRIPAEAGLGGGSADAAAVLRGLQRLHRMLDDKRLYSIALAVGADVPFLIQGGAARCEGVGEILTPFRAAPLWFLIVKPPQGISTRALYSGLKLPRERVSTLKAMAALASGEVKKLCEVMHNALEMPAIELCPCIADIKRGLLERGALAAQMTGSGSAVFGVFETEAAASSAAEGWASDYFVRVCRSI